MRMKISFYSSQVGDYIRFSNYTLNRESGIPPALKQHINRKVLEKYSQSLILLRKFNVSIAVIKYEGHPWHDGKCIDTHCCNKSSSFLDTIASLENNLLMLDSIYFSLRIT